MEAASMKAIALLVTLYSFQGVLLTLFSSTIPLILSEQGYSISQLSILSITSYPFSLKIILAPFVDTYYVSQLGKRRTYIIITGYILALLLLLSYPTIIASTQKSNHLSPSTVSNDASSLYPTALIAFSCILLIAIQDIAVDAWALKIISQQHLSFAPLSQSLGMTLGFLVAGSIFFILKISLESFLFYFSLTVLLSTTFIHFFVPESGFQAINNDTKDQSINRNEEIPKQQISSLLTTMRGFYRNSHLRMLIILLCVQNIGIGPILSSFNLRIQKAGVSKERISNSQVYLLPVQTAVPYLIAKYLKNTLKLGHKMLMLQLVVQVMQFTFYQIQSIGAFEGHQALQIAVIVAIQCVDSLVISGLIQVRSTFFAKVASQGFEGMYLTMLTSVQNISRRSTVSMFQYFDDYLNFNIATPLFWLVQVVFIKISWKKYEEMDGLDQQDWCLHSTTTNLKDVPKRDKED